MSRSHWLAAYFIVAVIVVPPVQFLKPSPAAAESAMVLPSDPTPLVAETAAGKRSFTIEIADDAVERSSGLMFRTEMNDDHGMLFVFEETQPVGFWMKNTPLPLDLVFAGEDGRVKAVLKGEPFSEAPITPYEPIRFVLELKQGVAQRSGITNGVRLRHPTIDQVAGSSPN
jgi:uncharacterized membrane protein (UPF0127 family)